MHWSTSTVVVFWVWVTWLIVSPAILWLSLDGYRRSLKRKKARHPEGQRAS